MSKQFNLLQNLINNLTTRERVLVLLGILSVIYLLWDSFLISPIQSVNKALLGERLSTQEQMLNLETRRILANGLLKNSKKQDIEKEIQRYKKKIKDFDGKIVERLQGRVAAENMVSLLNDVLRKNERLELISINNLPARPFVNQDEKNKDVQVEAQLVGIYMHSLEMQLHGSYLDILAYLQSLEKLPWKVFWDQVSLDVLEYPKIKVTIRVHTFSLKDGWLSV
jgi:MSHA biogenesis protein MshJ